MALLQWILTVHIGEAATPLFASNVGNLVIMPANAPKLLTYDP